jgi:hypothetical protein
MESNRKKKNGKNYLKFIEFFRKIISPQKKGLGDFQKRLYRCLSLSKATANIAFDKLRQHFDKLRQRSWYIYFWKSP